MKMRRSNIVWDDWIENWLTVVICSKITKRPSLVILILLLVVFAAGCQGESAFPLPTLVPTLELPAKKAPPQPSPEIPPTFTAEAEQPLFSGFAIAEKLEPTPTLQPTIFPSPTPLKISVNYSGIGEAPFFERPPEEVPCDGPGFVFRSQFPSNIGGPQRDYHAYLPPCYHRDGRAYPVIYLIHGSIQDDSHWFDLGLAQYADAGMKQGRYPPFIAIMPASGAMGNLTSGGDKSIEGIIVKELMPFVDETFCTWSENGGRNIGGISRGGYWALEVAFSNPDLFSAAAGHSSHLRLETDPEKYNPLATYASADLSNLRIWMDRGEKDFLRSGQEQLHASLLSAGITHDYFVNPGGHSGAYWAEHIGDYLDWHAAEWPRDRVLYPLCLP